MVVVLQTNLLLISSEPIAAIAQRSGCQPSLDTANMSRWVVWSAMVSIYADAIGCRPFRRQDTEGHPPR